MSERGFVLDTTVVSEVARGDMPLITLLLELDQQGLRLTVPALVVAAVAAEMGGSDKTGFLRRCAESPASTTGRTARWATSTTRSNSGRQPRG